MKRKVQRVKKQGVLTALCAAVAAKYQDEGDRIKAGVVVACLGYSPPRYYASVARYPDSTHHKQIVCSVGRAENTALKTAEEAVDALAQKWAAENQPAPVDTTMQTLSEVLK